MEITEIDINQNENEEYDSDEKEGDEEIIPNDQNKNIEIKKNINSKDYICLFKGDVFINEIKRSKRKKNNSKFSNMLNEIEI